MKDFVFNTIDVGSKIYLTITHKPTGMHVDGCTTGSKRTLRVILIRRLKEKIKAREDYERGKNNGIERVENGI